MKITDVFMPKEQFKRTLTAMGFYLGTGFKGEVWTNGSGPDYQVWVAMDMGAASESTYRRYDASTESINFTHFYHWLGEKNEEERDSFAYNPFDQ